MPHRAFIGVGSNLGDRRANIAEALERVAEIPNSRVVRTSSLYESEPHGPARNWFANLVFEFETELAPQDLLKRLNAIEENMGRKRAKAKTPAKPAKGAKAAKPAPKGKKDVSRVIDLDILFFNTEVITTRTLKVPHPEIARRRFVLMPLAEVAPQLVHPELGQTVSRMLATTEDKKRVTLMPPH
ncbi:MAG TPA: 2-amino-4-hydroxy-6-hydroxymethyldihydropteridine diphosphokinase [Candidatus Binatia bacterium]|nr:2-amino-4-hydroxy-6-hydroxymethyldihydropteridine diphosphokinase [Candidatus Binatia bacterium]